MCSDSRAAGSSPAGCCAATKRPKRTCCLVGAGHAEDVLAEVGEDEVVRDRCDRVEAGLPELALDVVLLREAPAAVRVEAGVRRRPGGLRGEQLGHVRLGTRRLALL